LAPSSPIRTASAEVGPEDGGFSTSLSCTWVRMFWFPTWRGGARRACPSGPATAYFPLAPDWVCEVLSPSTTRLDRTRKLGIYARERVAHAWLVDPLAQTLEVFRLEGGRWSLLEAHGGEATVRAEPFGEIDLELRLLWSDPPSPA
jgi:hypothetical protein